ncbi:MFS transporter [Streptomyces misionensis]|uniref:MFS transporter n=1 Tax=Streptomyces misionensis TaxID=67331 RepID=UPI0033C17927
MTEPTTEATTGAPPRGPADICTPVKRKARPAASARSLRAYWAGEATSLAGSPVHAVALPVVAVVQLHATPGQVSLLATASTAAACVLALPAGVVGDRHGKRPLMVATDLAAAAVVAAVPLCWATGSLSMPVLYTVALLLSVLTVLHQAASIAIVPRFVRPQDLPAAHSRIEAACSVADTAGTYGGTLVVGLVGARLASRPQHSAAALADSLVRRAALAHTHREDPIQMVIASALNETYNGLAEETKRLYRYLGTLPGRDISPDMAAAITGLPWPQAAAGLESLADEFLLEPSAAHHDGVHYRLVSAARGHARELALRHDPEDERLLVQRRLCEWFLSIAGQAQQRLAPAQATLQRSMGCADQAYPAPFSDDAGAMAWLDTYESALLDILRVAEEAEWHELIWRTVDAWWPHFLRRHPYELWVTAHEIGLAAARRAGRDAAVRQMLASGAIGLTAAGRLDEAITWYTRALEAARAAGDIRDEGQALHGLGSCHRQAGRPDHARGLLMHAIARWEQCGYQRGIALSTIVLGEIALPDDAAHALDLFTRAHALLLELDDSFEAARALALKGHARVVTGEAADGIEAMEGALRMLTETGSIRWQARTLELLGHAYQDQGEPRTAGDCYRQAAALYADIAPAEAERVRGLEHAQ